MASVIELVGEDDKLVSVTMPIELMSLVAREMAPSGGAFVRSGPGRFRVCLAPPVLDLAIKRSSISLAADASTFLLSVALVVVGAATNEELYLGMGLVASVCSGFALANRVSRLMAQLRLRQGVEQVPQSGGEDEKAEE